MHSTRPLSVHQRSCCRIISTTQPVRIPVILTNRGKGSHVLLSFEEFAEYEEFRHNRYLMQKIEEAESDPDTRLIDHDQLWSKIDEKYGL